jgi:diguanylate cyclase (GGDEF)-like protein
LACLLALSTVLHAQQFVFRAFRQAEGLKNLAVNAMTTDREGFLWLGTENGVYRFLGSGFERFGPEQGIGEVDILNMLASPDGTVWAGTEENLYRWDGRRFLPAGPEPIHLLGLRRLAVEDAHHLLVVDRSRLFRLEYDAQGRMLSYLPVIPGSLVASIPDLAKVSSVSVVHGPSNELQVWIGCGKKLYSLREHETGGRIQQLAGGVMERGKEKGLAEDRWESVLLDRGGTLWAAGQHHMAAMPPGSSRFANRPIPGSGQGNILGHAPLIEDRQGRVLASDENGIARWDGNGWRVIGRANGLEHTDYIAGMAFDAAGDLWFASRGGGLYNWAGYANWEGWDNRQGLPSASVWAIMPSPGADAFIGTNKGPARIDSRSGLVRPLFSGSLWPFGSVSALAKNRDGSLLATTFSGALVRIDPKTGHAEEAAKLSSYIIDALIDSTGRLFLATRDGLFMGRFGIPNDRSSSMRQKVGDAQIVPRRVRAVDALLGDPSKIEGGCESPGGSLWFLGNNRLVRFKDRAWTAPPVDGLPQKLRGTLLSLFCAADGAVWVTGDQTGTWRLTADGERMQARQLELPSDLSSLAPMSILVDRRGWVWLGTDLGLAVWNGRSWRHLTQESGLIWNDVDQGTMREGSDGSLWIGTSGGVAHLLHPERVFDSIPLSVSLTEIRRGAVNYLGAQQITLPWGGPPLHFQISSPTMRNRSELTLKLQMAGLQANWIETRDGDVVYSKLEPGAYTFTAIACNPGLNACSAPLKVDVRVLSPWWRTGWFYTFCGLVLLLLLVAAGRLQARYLREKSQWLEKLVSERTQELEASREQLRIQATHDGLTGMLNRTAILRALTAELDRAQREKRTVVVVLVDLDYFKNANDTFGHMAGDEALCWFAAAVGAAIRPYDHAGRYGGEEFLLVLTEVPREAVEQRLAHLHTAISNLQVSWHGGQFKISCSMGATVFDPFNGPETVESLLTVADQALYAAKAEGRNRVIFYAAARPDAYSGGQGGRRSTTI